MINIEDYFEKGYSITRVPENLLAKFWMEIYTTTWVTDPESVYKSKPDWYSNVKKYNLDEDGDLQNIVERTYGNELIKLAPTTLTDTANELIKLEYFTPLRAFKESASLSYLHFWNGAEEIPWHYDTIDGSDTLVFIYLTEEQHWDPLWGGSISFCKELTSGKQHIQTVLPNNGVMVVVNNSNPLFKHKVEALKNNNINRYTLSLCYKWK